MRTLRTASDLESMINAEWPSGAPAGRIRPDDQHQPATSGYRRPSSGPFEAQRNSARNRMDDTYHRPAERSPGVRRSDSVFEGNRIRARAHDGFQRDHLASGSGHRNNRFLSCVWPRRARIALWAIAAGMVTAAIVIVVMTPEPGRVSVMIGDSDRASAADRVAQMSSRIKRF